MIDVRSPGEYVQGHIPGAYNLPLFSNEERAVIGTLYVQRGKEPAMKEGMEIVGRKFGSFIETVAGIAPGKKLLIHCWRGGMRSESLAWFFGKLGYEVSLLEGGYKAYRRFIRDGFNRPANILLLGGMTGSGKTELLGKIAAQGQQAIDLEWLANHKGSAFGHLGQDEQPTTEQFENDLYALWSKLDFSKPVWLEHESNRIGKVFFPDTFYATMQKGILLKVDLPVEIRIQRLLNEYAHFDNSLLAASLLHIRMEMGTLQCKQALDALERGDYEEVARISLEYYDKTYTHALAKRPLSKVIGIRLSSADMDENANSILEFAKANNLISEYKQ